MTDLLDFMQIDKPNTGKTRFFPKTLAKGIFITDDLSINGKTLDQFINNHKHTIADIADLNISSDGSLILKPLTVVFNGSKIFEYNGILAQTLDFNLSSLGAAVANHNHDGVYSKEGHNHSGYAPIVHTHSMADITDFSGGGGISEISPLTVTFGGFEQIVFDGKSPKTLDISPSAINAADKDHAHTFSSITDVSLPNLSIKLLGIGTDDSGNYIDDITIIDYTGSTAKLVEISAYSVGASPRGHNHPGLADKEHTHSKTNITDFPTSMPANGGNADTVDGKHATDFIQKIENYSNWITIGNYFTKSIAQCISMIKVRIPDMTHLQTVTAMALPSNAAAVLSLEGTVNIDDLVQHQLPLSAATYKPGIYQDDKPDFPIITLSAANGKININFDFWIGNMLDNTAVPYDKQLSITVIAKVLLY